MRTVVAASLCLLVACGHAIYRYPMTMGRASSEPNGQGLRMSVEWLKGKQKSIDVALFFENRYAFPISVKRGYIKLSWQDRTGALRDTGGSIVLGPGQNAREILIYQFWPEIPAEGGEVTIAVDAVHKADGTESPGATLRLPMLRQYRE